MSDQVTPVDGAAIVEQKQGTQDESKQISDKVDEPKESIKISDECQESKETCEKPDQDSSSGHNLKALLNLDSDKNETVPLGELKSSAPVASKPASSKPSVSFNTPKDCGDQFSKAVGSASARDQNIPLLDRMMSNGQSPGIDPGYGSFEPKRFGDFSQDAKSKPREHFLPQFASPRPSAPSVIELDIAVANALRNLQTLQEQRASVLGSTYLGRPDVNNNDPHNVLSALLTGAIPQPLLLHQRPLLLHQSPQRPLQNLQPGNYLENAARSYRAAATVHEATCTWSGQLPPRASGSGTDLSFSSKVFLGGIPWDITEESLVDIFGQFGAVRVVWPGRDITTPPKGYLYVTFESEESVKDLLKRCTHDMSDGGSFYYYKISSNRMRSKEVQVIPWAIVDSNFVRCPTVRLDPLNTVFVGALHGMMNAEGLAIVFNDLFGGVVYAGLDTDKHKYPIGSGRVTFNNAKSYMKAVTAAFIEIKTPQFSKNIQVDPYLEDALCNTCGTKQGPYFCRDLSCFKYFCRFCWELRHAFLRPPHKPLMRHIRGINRERWDSCYMDTRSGIPRESMQSSARGLASSSWEFMRTTQSPVSHMATLSREPSSHMATPSREPSTLMATPSREPSTLMATPSRELIGLMATPSREPNLVGERVLPSREAFPGRVANLSKAEAGFTRWNPRKDAPEFDPVLPRSKAMENQKTTPLTLDIFIKNVMRNEPGDRVKNGKEPKNESAEEDSKEI